MTPNPGPATDIPKGGQRPSRWKAYWARYDESRKWSNWSRTQKWVWGVSAVLTLTLSITTLVSDLRHESDGATMEVVPGTYSCMARLDEGNIPHRCATPFSLMVAADGTWTWNGLAGTYEGKRDSVAFLPPASAGPSSWGPAKSNGGTFFFDAPGAAKDVWHPIRTEAADPLRTSLATTYACVEDFSTVIPCPGVTITLDDDGRWSQEGGGGGTWSVTALRLGGIDAMRFDGPGDLEPMRWELTAHNITYDLLVFANTAGDYQAWEAVEAPGHPLAAREALA